MRAMDEKQDIKLLWPNKSSRDDKATTNCIVVSVLTVDSIPCGRAVNFYYSLFIITGCGGVNHK